MIQLCVVSVIKVHKSLPAEKDLIFQKALEIARGKSTKDYAVTSGAGSYHITNLMKWSKQIWVYCHLWDGLKL